MIRLLMNLRHLTERTRCVYRGLLTGWLRRRTAAWLGVLLWLGAGLAWARNPDFLLQTWLDRDGIPESTALAVAQTPDGYLWVGSPDGLLRFNGVQFTRGDGPAGQGRLEGVVTFLQTDRSGRLWAGGNGEVAMYEAGIWRRLAVTNLDLRSVAQGWDGQVWLGGTAGQLYAVANGRIELRPAPDTVMPSGMFCLTDARDGGIWLANRGFIGRWTPRGWSRMEPGPSTVKSLVAAPAQNGGIWVYLPGTLRLYQTDGSVTQYPAPDFDQPRELREDRTGNLWLATISSGLACVRPGGIGNPWSSVTRTNGLTYNALRCLTEDREGNIWTGGSHNGLNRLKLRQFVTFGRAEGLPENLVRSVAEPAPGTILVGMQGGGTARIVAEKVEPDIFAAEEGRGRNVWSLVTDRAGQLWVGTFNDGLFVETNRVRRPFPLPAGLGTSIAALMEDSRGRIWVGTTAGMCVIEAGQVTELFAHTPLAGFSVTSFAEDRMSGEIWVGTYAHGVFRLGGDHFQQVAKLPGLPGERVSSLAMDANHYLWVGIYGHGLACLHEGKTALIGPDQGLFVEAVGSILDDGLGCFWMGTTHGILRVAQDELYRLAQGATRPATFSLFNTCDGLDSEYCAEGYQPAALRDHSGRLWFGTDRGVVSVDPLRLRLNTNPPPVVAERVEYLDRAGRPHALHGPIAGPLVLPPGSVEFAFGFCALSYTAPEKIKFAYRVEPIDPHWIHLGSRHDVHFHQLAPGTYTLHFKAANNDGVWNETGTTVRFTLQPYFWQTLSFQGVVVLALVVGGGGVVRRLTRAQFQRRLELLQRERQLAQERARLATVVEQSAEIIVITDPQGTILYVNPSFERITGYSQAEAIGQNPRLLKSGRQDAQFYGELWRTLKSGQVWRGHFVNRRKDGALFEEEATISPVRDAAGQIISYAGVKRDVTREVQLETALRQAQKMEAIGQLAGGVAHDFNNILSSLLMQTELLGMTDALTPEIREGLQQITADARRAADLTRQLLLFGRRQVMQSRVLDLNDVVLNMSRLLQRLIRENVRLELNLHPTPLWTQADTGMLEQVLMNLAVNARDAMPKGGELRIETTRVVVDVQSIGADPEAAPGPHVRLSVADTGKGIAPEILSRIFEPFFTTKEPGRGTGLGLATVFGIVKQHRGWIQVDNHPGRGVTFHVYLPVANAPAAAAGSSERKPGARMGTETILLVEDESAVRKITREILVRHGYTVLEAVEAQAALEVWQAHRGQVALLLTDLVMPGEMGGQDLGRRLRAERPGLKVIYASGYSADVAGKDFALQAGEIYVQKPFAKDQLLEAVRCCLDS